MEPFKQKCLGSDHFDLGSFESYCRPQMNCKTNKTKVWCTIIHLHLLDLNSAGNKSIWSGCNNQTAHEIWLAPCGRKGEELPLCPDWMILDRCSFQNSYLPLYHRKVLEMMLVIYSNDTLYGYYSLLRCPWKKFNHHFAYVFWIKYFVLSIMH